MSERSKDRGVDRRDFMIAAAVSVSASAALGTTIAQAKSQESASPTESADVAQKGAVLTGDVIQGKRVVSALDVNALKPGKHSFYFQGVQMPTGQHWYVSVIVAKGTKAGKRITLVSGVHGDEMNPVVTVQRVMQQLDPAQMSGTVLAALDVSRPAIEGWQGDGPIRAGESISST